MDRPAAAQTVNSPMFLKEHPVNETDRTSRRSHRPASADIGDVYAAMSTSNDRGAKPRRAGRHQRPGLHVAHLMMLR